MTGTETSRHLNDGDDLTATKRRRPGRKRGKGWGQPKVQCRVGGHAGEGVGQMEGAGRESMERGCVRGYGGEG